MNTQQRPVDLLEEKVNEKQNKIKTTFIKNKNQKKPQKPKTFKSAELSST